MKQLSDGDLHAGALVGWPFLEVRIEARGQALTSHWLHTALQEGM